MNCEIGSGWDYLELSDKRTSVGFQQIECVPCSCCHRQLLTFSPNHKNNRHVTTTNLSKVRSLLTEPRVAASSTIVSMSLSGESLSASLSGQHKFSWS